MNLEEIKKQVENIKTEIQNNPNLSIQCKNLILNNIENKIKEKGYFQNNLFQLDNIYLVGGAVRDKVMGIQSKDHDYVLVNYTAKQLEEMGFKQVGADFPVFLDDNQIEYALARQERKANKHNNPYLDFEFNTENVSIEDDLKKRDLTINAMAMPVDWHFNPIENELIDPYGGLNDIANKKLRHVSDAFADDPVRVLRVCRFAGRYYFEIDEETRKLCRQIVDNGSLNHVTSERIFKEFEKGFSDNYPYLMIQEMQLNGSLKAVLPEVDKLFGVPQPPEHHPEIDSGLHTLLVLRQACLNNLSPKAKFACLLHDVGKGLTKPELYPKHIGHEDAGVPLVQNICDRLKVPSDWRDLAVNVCRDHLRVHRSLEMNATKIVQMIKKNHGLNKNNTQFQELVDCCLCDSRGRKGFEDRPYLPKEYLLKIQESLITSYNPVLQNKIKETVKELNEKGQKHLIEEKVYQLQVSQCKHTISKYKHENNLKLIEENKQKQKNKFNKKN